MSILISIICKSRRPELWRSFYNQFKTDKVNFEIIFIGPFLPKEKLSENCKFIQSFVKPSQCDEIGIRYSSGKYICIFADDLISKTIDPLYLFKNEIETNNYSEQILINPKAKSHGDSLNKPLKDFNYLYVPWAPLFRRSILEKINSFDSRFIAVLHDTDLYLRMLQHGCKIFDSEVEFVEETRKKFETSIFQEYAARDRSQLKKMWFINNKFSLKINQKNKTYSRENILNISYKPKGKWRFSNYYAFLFFNSKIIRGLLKILKFDFPIFHKFYYNHKENIFIKIFARTIKKIFY